VSFNSFQFIVFFCAVFGITALLQRRITVRNAFLLVASYYFYACWDWRFLILIIISTLVDYLCGRAMQALGADAESRTLNQRKRKLVLLMSLSTNLGLLGFFKYFNFFIDSTAALLSSLGLQANVTTLNIILPVGISFYTFQTLSYTIDLYRGRIDVERNLLTFAVYVAFFPQLVAGPIERAGRLLPQFRKPSRITTAGIYYGTYLIAWGLFKKVVLADNVALFVNQVFSMDASSGLASLLALYAFAIQIYCDFSAYSDIARGTAKCMGFDLMLNFNLPYLATNPSDFWSRWHISLSTWLRDYLYIPLGGNRCRPWRCYFNLMLTMVLGGLWHGAAWTFVCWGIYHGFLLCIHRAATPWMERRISPHGKWTGRIWYAVRLCVFFHLVCIGWLLFRAENLSQAMTMMASIVTSFAAPIPTSLTVNLCLSVLACGLTLLIVQLIQYLSRDLNVIFRAPVWVRGLVFAGFILGFVIFGASRSNEFIYFQF